METAERCVTSKSGNSSAPSFDAEYTDAPASLTTIYFTSCGTESDNWAIKGAAKRLRAKGRDHIVTSAIEHHAVLNACAALEREGFSVTYVGVDADGVVNYTALLIRKDHPQLTEIVTEYTNTVKLLNDKPKE